MTRLLWICVAAAIPVGQTAQQTVAGSNPGSARPCDPAAAERLVRRARAPVTEPRLAAELLGQAYVACPARPEYLLETAMALAENREFGAAIETADRFLEVIADPLPGLLVKADAQFMAQRFEGAIETSALALRMDPGNVTALKVQANALYLGGDSSGAEAVFLRLLARYPSDGDAAYMLGRIYYQENRFDLAAAQFQKVLRMDPGSYKAYDNLGLCYEALGDSEQAVRHYLTAIKLVETEHPKYDWPYANLANLLIDRNDLQRGLEAASAAARRNPHSARNFFLAGKALVRLERYRDAQRWLERSVALDSDHSQALYWLSRVYTRLGNIGKARRALADFEAAKANEPNDIR